MNDRPDLAQQANPLFRYFRIDFPGGRQQPRTGRILLATIAAILISVAVCAVLATVGPIVFPAIRGYGHYAPSDYIKLTVIGVIIGCLGWPIITLVSSHARRLYGWLTVILSIVLLAPDVWILLHGQSPEGVLVLAVMHVAVAAAIYLCATRIAPQPSAT